jgi:hypothetical protein
MFEIDCEVSVILSERSRSSAHGSQACERVPRSNAVYISYNVRVHFCKQCYDLKCAYGRDDARVIHPNVFSVKKGSTILRTFNKATRSRIPETIFSMLPTYGICSHMFANRFLPGADISYRGGAENRDWNSYYTPELELVVNEYFKLTDLAERDEFVRRRQSLTNMLMEVSLCRSAAHAL